MNYFNMLISLMFPKSELFFSKERKLKATDQPQLLTSTRLAPLTLLYSHLLLCASLSLSVFPYLYPSAAFLLKYFIISPVSSALEKKLIFQFLTPPSKPQSHFI